MELDRCNKDWFLFCNVWGLRILRGRHYLRDEGIRLEVCRETFGLYTKTNPFLFTYR